MSVVERGTTGQSPQRVTVREVLIGAHHISGLDPRLNGIQYGSTVRILAHVAALVVRKQLAMSGARRFRDDSFNEEAIDAALDELSPHTNLFDAEHPFMQLPVRDGAMPTDPVKKLLPQMPPDRAEQFWDRASGSSALPLADAVLALIGHSFYSFGGNNSLDGLKCINGSPGIRYPGKDYTATEVLWSGSSLFRMLTANIPQNWVDGSGLPAWADPDGKTACLDDPMVEHPLWRASWASNTARCAWSDTELLAAAIGGSPNRPPRMGTQKEQAKVWWDLRNADDPFYLYVTVEKRNKAGVLLSSERKAQRLDFGYAESQLAAEWHSKRLSSALKAHGNTRVMTPDDDAQIIFLRHLVQGSASSPVIRRSEVMISERSRWQVSEERADAVAAAATIVKEVCSELCKPFSQKGRLGVIANRRGDVEAEFWSRVDQPFRKYILNSSADSASIDPEVWPAVREAALEAFDAVAASAPQAKLSLILMVARNRIGYNVSKVLGLLPQKTAA